MRQQVLYRFWRFGSVVSCVVMAIVLAPLVGKAVDRYVSPEIRYQKAVQSLQQGRVLGTSHSASQAFIRLDWVGKTALINLVCQGSDSKMQICQDVLRRGLRDEALVVRDHSLRTLLASGHFPSELKLRVAQSIVDDERNYRRGRELWIVRNARDFLQKSAPGADALTSR